MADRLGSHDFVYVHTDIPAGMTLPEWRAQRAAGRPATNPRPLLAAGIRMVVLARLVWRAGSRALARPRIARVRVPVGRHRAPRPAAPQPQEPQHEDAI